MTVSEQKQSTQGLYDRIADVQNLAMKVNGYRASVAKFLRSLDLKLCQDPMILDAGCGTGVTTLALLEANFDPRHVTALDLSFKSLEIARVDFATKKDAAAISSVQGNVLKFPFADATFDLVITCGVLEYTPLDEGLGEIARVMKRGASLVLLPVKQSRVGSMLELFYNFKIHNLSDVRAQARQYFNIVGNYEFPSTEPISWSKTIFLLQKK